MINFFPLVRLLTVTIGLPGTGGAGGGVGAFGFFGSFVFGAFGFFGTFGVFAFGSFVFGAFGFFGTFGVFAFGAFVLGAFVFFLPPPNMRPNIPGPPPYLTPPPPKNLGVPVMLTLLGNATAEVLAGALELLVFPTGALDVEFTGAFVFIARELLFPPVLLAELFIALPLLPLLLYAELPMLFMELPDVAVLLYALFPLETVLFENSDVTVFFVRGLTSITGS